MALRKLAPLLAATLTALVAGPASAALGMPDALTPRGQLVGSLYTMIATLAIIMFCIVFAWLVVVVVRFREGSGHGRATHEKERHSLKAELTWTFVPLMMVLYIGYAAYGGLVQLDHGIDPKDAKMELKVEGRQWSWVMDYGAGVRVDSSPDSHTGEVKDANAFVVPQDTALLFNITSTDVIHAFQVLDANRAFVSFNDANPLGANKYNLQTVSLPNGTYFVQCNKMCLNPGHAYMHATIKAVPQAQFDHWLAGRKAEAGANVVNHLSVNVGPGGITQADGKPFGTLNFTTGSRVVLDVHGTGSLTGPNGTKAFQAGAADNFFAVDLWHAGDFEVSAGSGAALKLHAFNALPASVTLVDFALKPNELTLKAGETYLVSVPNLGHTGHNLFVGHFGAGEPLAFSPTVDPNGQTAVVLKLEKGTYDMWCNVPGHYGSGMHGTITVA